MLEHIARVTTMNHPCLLCRRRRRRDRHRHVSRARRRRSRFHGEQTYVQRLRRAGRRHGCAEFAVRHVEQYARTQRLCGRDVRTERRVRLGRRRSSKGKLVRKRRDEVPV